jgi:hypothetical protein
MITNSEIRQTQGSCTEVIQTHATPQHSSDHLSEIEFLIDMIRGVDSENNLPNWHAEIGSLYIRTHNFMEAEKHYDISFRQLPQNRSKGISDMVHTDLYCDHCKTFPIRGFRYRCGSCNVDDDDGYDLRGRCFVCRSDLHDAEHLFIQIPRTTSYLIYIGLDIILSMIFLLSPIHVIFRYGRWVRNDPSRIRVCCGMTL